MALLIAFFWLLEPAFLSERNIRAILNVVSFVGIIAIGQTILLVAGEFDLSVGSVAGLSAVVAAKLMTAVALPVSVAIIGGVGVGALVGLVNGLIVVRLGIPAFIQTLGMLFIGQGLIQVVTDGVSGLSAAGGNQCHRHAPTWSSDSAGALPSSSSPPSSPISSCGAPCSAATCMPPAAIRKWRASSASTPTLYKIGAFIVVGALAAIAGMFVMADLGSGTTSIGSGWELTVIAGVVVGGVSLFGGAGTVAGGVVGILMLKVVQSGLVVIGVNSNWQQIAVGVIMVLAVGLDILRRRYFIAGA